MIKYYIVIHFIGFIIEVMIDLILHYGLLLGKRFNFGNDYVEVMWIFLFMVVRIFLRLYLVFSLLILEFIRYFMINHHRYQN